MLRKETRHIDLAHIIKESWWVFLFITLTFSGFIYAANSQKKIAREIQEKIELLQNYQQLAYEEKEYLDINENKSQDMVTVLQFITFLSTKAKEKIYDEPNSKNSLTSVQVKSTIQNSIRYLDSSLNKYNSVCSPKALESIDCHYIGDDLFDFYQKTQEEIYPAFSSEDLNALLNLATQTLYDESSQKSTYLMSSTSEHLIPLMKSFKGEYSPLLRMLANGFKPNGGFMTFMFENLKIPKHYKYTTMDVFKDLNTLLSTKVMREYKKPDTFWWQFAELTRGFAHYAYVQKRKTFDSNLNGRYYNQASNIFR